MGAEAGDLGNQAGLGALDQVVWFLGGFGWFCLVLFGFVWLLGGFDCFLGFWVALFNFSRGLRGRVLQAHAKG